MVKNPLFFQPNRSFDFGIFWSIYCFFYTHISIS